MNICAMLIVANKKDGLDGHLFYFEIRTHAEKQKTVLLHCLCIISLRVNVITRECEWLIGPIFIGERFD